MTSLDDFRDKLRAAMASIEAPYEANERERLMAEREQREAIFWEIADRLLQAVIEPRLAILVELFENAQLARHNPRNARSVFLGYLERFPANASLEFQLLPDDDCRSIVVQRETHIAPAYMRFDRFAKWETLLDTIDQNEATVWIEGQLLLFAKTLIRFTRESPAGEPIPALDPVCGMTVRAEPASVRAEYLGHPYYFCSVACRDRFLEQPLMFVSVASE